LTWIVCCYYTFALFKLDLKRVGEYSRFDHLIVCVSSAVVGKFYKRNKLAEMMSNLPDREIEFLVLLNIVRKSLTWRLICFGF